MINIEAVRLRKEAINKRKAELRRVQRMQAKAAKILEARTAVIGKVSRSPHKILPAESRSAFSREDAIVFGRAVLPFNQVLGCWYNAAGVKFFQRERAERHAMKMHRAIVQ